MIKCEPDLEAEGKKNIINRRERNHGSRNNNSGSNQPLKLFLELPLPAPWIFRHFKKNQKKIKGKHTNSMPEESRQCFKVYCCCNTSSLNGWPNSVLWFKEASLARVLLCSVEQAHSNSTNSAGELPHVCQGRWWELQQAWRPQQNVSPTGQSTALQRGKMTDTFIFAL